MAEAVETPDLPGGAERGEWSAVDSVDPCPRCNEPVPPPRGPARMARKARLLLVACLPLNFVWFVAAGYLLMFVPTPLRPANPMRGLQLYLSLCFGMTILCFAPTILLAWWAWKLPRVVSVRCRGCGWSEERIQPRR